MSKENLEQFMNQIAESEELQAKIGEEIDAEALIALGAECGCEFTAEELQDSAELSDEELDGVAGGPAFVKMDGISPRTTGQSSTRGGAYDAPLNFEEIKVTYTDRFSFRVKCHSRYGGARATY